MPLPDEARSRRQRRNWRPADPPRGALDSSAFKLHDLRNYDEYTYFHSVNVCVLGTTLFHDYVRDEPELLDFGIGLLLHDIGKSKIDLKILNKPGRLTEEEFA